MVPGTIDDIKLTAVANKITNHQQFSELLGFYVKGELNMSEELAPGWTKPFKRKELATESAQSQGPLPQFGGNGVDSVESAEQRKLANQKLAEKAADEAVERGGECVAVVLATLARDVEVISKPAPEAQRQRIRDSVQQNPPQPLDGCAAPRATVTETMGERVEVTLKFTMDVQRLVQLMK